METVIPIIVGGVLSFLAQKMKNHGWNARWVVAVASLVFAFGWALLQYFYGADFVQKLVQSFVEVAGTSQLIYNYTKAYYPEVSKR